jgi:hypothetical protein
VGRVSDLSGKHFALDDEPVRLVILEHPHLAGPPVQLEVFLSEVAPAMDAALSVAVFEAYVPGESSPRRMVVDAGDFDAIASDVPMTELLKLAPRVKGGKASKRRGAGTGINYASVEHAGRPHRGRVTEAEARIVREHFDEVNARLAQEGNPQIDPDNPADAARYGFAERAPAPDAA